MCRICSVEGCNNKHHGKGYCSKHYMQMKKHGKILERTTHDPNEIIFYDDYAEIIICNKDYEEVARTIIDLDDVEKVKQYKWRLSKGYAHNDTISLHRFIMNCPSNMVVDHINRNPLDNRKCNLRICTQQQNSMNRNVQSNNTSGITGVSWNKRTNKWLVRIKLNGKTKCLGYFKNLEEAKKVREQAEIEYFGEYRNNEDVG